MKKIGWQETCGWGKKNKSTKNKQKQKVEWDTSLCKEIYKTKITAVIGHKKLPQKFQTS